MSPLRLVPAAALAACLLSPGPAGAQTADRSPGAPASPGLAGGSRTASGTGGRRMSPDAKLPDTKMRAPRKSTAAERAEQKKLEHDLRICIGC